ncbi:hypothetical protein LFT45_03910 [Arthrobacter sp. FW305-BF8]|uniref:hypothetical protein n=1 Tax=Arthrobacter sp. FW305-BF8 TaxID=2879617 RepID=UPI001F1D9CFA|nr:hypothetical protein [Arthrobacter sp. FW305-BF8]UKA55099.1 hypothetical protein LFT45_03910 [Arthrobacter sp. FW305-BF8]
MEEELQRAAQALYALPFDDFIAARTAASKEAATSDKPLAQAIRTLPKPSVAAWTVNMLAHHRPEAVQQLRVLGQAMQEAQASLDAAALRELAKERRKLLGTAVGEARLAAEEQGRKISGPVATEVEETLRAATADLAAAAAVESGLLLRGLSADGVDQVDVTDAVAVPSALGKLPPRPLPPQRPGGARRPIGGGPKSRPEEPSATAAPAGRRARTQPPKAADKTDAEEQQKPRLRAVRSAPRPVPPSLLEKAQAALAEAEEAAADAAGEAARRAQAQEDAAAAFVQLTADVNEARQRLRALELSLDAARKQRDTAAAEAKQYARAAEKSERSAVLAKERVLRLRNTPD